MPEKKETKYRHELKYQVTDAQIQMLKNRINHLLPLDRVRVNRWEGEAGGLSVCRAPVPRPPQSQIATSSRIIGSSPSELWL